MWINILIPKAIDSAWKSKSFLPRPVYKHSKSIFANRAADWRKLAMRQHIKKKRINEEIHCTTNKGKMAKNA